MDRHLPESKSFPGRDDQSGRCHRRESNVRNVGNVDTTPGSGTPSGRTTSALGVDGGGLGNTLDRLGSDLSNPATDEIASTLRRIGHLPLRPYGQGGGRIALSASGGSLP